MFKAIDLKGTNGTRISFQTRLVGSSSSSIAKTLNNFLSDTTAKSTEVLFERITPRDYKITQGGTTEILRVPNSDTMTNQDKILKVVVGTIYNDKYITEGTIEIYGRKRM